MYIFEIISVVSVSICFFMFFYIRWYLKHKTSAKEILKDHINESQSLILDIHEATEMDSMLVKERIDNLKKILENADKRIAKYVEDIEKASFKAEAAIHHIDEEGFRQIAGETLYTSLGRGIRSALNTPLDPSSAVSALQKKGMSANAAINENFVNNDSFANNENFTNNEKIKIEKNKKNPAVAKENPKVLIRTQIDNLLTEGLSPEEIASRLNISLAEVTLAMNLLRRGSSLTNKKSNDTL